MKHKLLAALLAACLLALPACTPATPAEEDGEDTLRIVATTYPVYLFTTAITQGLEDVEVTLLVQESLSCLHDYTLTVDNMKAIEKADVIAINGAGLEDFMVDALAQSTAQVIDCAKDIALLEAQGHEGHDHDTEFDPHIWMDPDRAIQMLENLASALTGLQPERENIYQTNLEGASSLLRNGAATAVQELTAIATGHTSLDSVTAQLELITFHDGFQYFADAFGLDLLKAIEEEEGSEASAAEIKEIVALIDEHQLSAIYTEVNGSTATAQAIARETGVAVYPLDMIMSGEGTGIHPYLNAMKKNLQIIVYGAEALP